MYKKARRKKYPEVKFVIELDSVVGVLVTLVVVDFVVVALVVVASATVFKITSVFFPRDEW